MNRNQRQTICPDRIYLNNAATGLREFERLKNINDNYTKYVISMAPLVKKVIIKA